MDMGRVKVALDLIELSRLLKKAKESWNLVEVLNIIREIENIIDKGVIDTKGLEISND